MFDRKLIDQVITLWNKASDVRGSAPPFLMVKTIMETVFLAGLYREEDRPVQIMVSLLEPEFFDQRGPAGESLLLCWEKRQPFSVHALKKLAPAFDPITTALAVCQAPAGAEYGLDIWGAVFTSTRGGGRFDSVALSLTPPEVLTVASKKTGTLTVYRGSEVIARFHSGQFFTPIATPFSANLMGWTLLHGIRTHPEFRRNGMDYWNLYRDFLTLLLTEMSNRGVGGTIIWIPEHMTDWEKLGIEPRHVMSFSPEGAPLLEDLYHTEQQLQASMEAYQRNQLSSNCLIVEEIVLECKRRIIEHAELLAQLTRVDGAMILSSRLQPLAFGSVLDVPQWRGDIMHGLSNTQDAVLHPVNMISYGTRHSSAVNFVGRNSGSLAFVLSQDGPVTGLACKDTQTVYWWPDCLGKHRLPGHASHRGPYGD